MSNRSRARLPPRQRLGRSGARWEQARAEMFRQKGRICWICGHDGASDADHRIPLSRGGSRYDQGNLYPAHGITPCYLCPRGKDGKPRRCNQSRGNGVTSGRGTRKESGSQVRLNVSEPW